MSQRDPEWEPPFGTPQAVANPGGMIRADTEQTAVDDRLEQLPDFENDELRGASQQGAGILSQGGTVQETGQQSGSDRPPAEDREGPASLGAVLPIPLVGEEPREADTH